MLTCAHLAAVAAGCDSAFTIDASRVTFGVGALAEVGDRARVLGIRRIAVITDPRLRALPWFDDVARSLAAAGLDAAVFDDVAIEPTDASFEAAARFAADARPDGFLSLGGGSVIDTAKAANLLATHPAPLRAYLNAPIGDARAVPGPLAPHLACPTTSGTGSEVTGIAICTWSALHAKTGIASPRLRPTEAIVDPRATATLPAAVVAASGADVLCHALESFTARRFAERAAPAAPTARPMSQGGNPWSDLGCREAIRLCAAYLERAVRDAGDAEARHQMMWAATLAGIAFGNAGVHAPHAMGYAVGERAAHGAAVAANAPAVFRRFGAFCADRHLEAAALLGADVRGAAAHDAGAVLAARFADLGRAIGVPVGIAALGYSRADLDVLVARALPQQRLLANAPCELDAACLRELFEQALS